MNQTADLLAAAEERFWWQASYPTPHTDALMASVVTGRKSVTYHQLTQMRDRDLTAAFAAGQVVFVPQTLATLEVVVKPAAGQDKFYPRKPGVRLQFVSCDWSKYQKTRVSSQFDFQHSYKE